MNDYERIARVIRFLDRNHLEQPDLATLASEVGLSRYHFHRLFVRWAGVTPKDFLKCLTLAHARRLLAEGESVLSTALETGLSGPGRLHDLTVTLEAASPGEVKSGGRGWTIEAGFADTPFGTALFGVGPRGLCHLTFEPAEDPNAGIEQLTASWPHAEIRWSEETAREVSERVFRRETDAPYPTTLRAWVAATEFQLRVWRALLRVPPGTLVSYGRLAAAAGSPGAARAVGTALSKNPLAFLIPCHRVIRETGVVGDYRWDSARKRVLIAWESASEWASPTVDMSTL